MICVIASIGVCKIENFAAISKSFKFRLALVGDRRRIIVIRCFERCGGCFSACITAGVGCGGGECGGDVAIVEVVVNACDGDGLGCIPVAGGEGQR